MHLIQNTPLRNQSPPRPTKTPARLVCHVIPTSPVLDFNVCTLVASTWTALSGLLLLRHVRIVSFGYPMRRSGHCPQGVAVPCLVRVVSGPNSLGKSLDRR